MSSCMSSLWLPLSRSHRIGNDDDLEYYIREVGAILGVSTRVDPAKRDAKHILEYVFRQLVEFKKLNQE